MRYLCPSSTSLQSAPISTAFLFIFSFSVCLCVCGQRENLQGEAEESEQKDREASPVFSCTSTLCLLVVTVTGRQEEPGGKAKGWGRGGLERMQ